jgi:hypothetical protein
MKTREAPVCECCGQPKDWDGERWVCLTATRASLRPNRSSCRIGQPMTYIGNGARKTFKVVETGMK